jgi:hypothetical protein
MIQSSTIPFAIFQIFNLASKYLSNVFDNLEKNRLVPNRQGIMVYQGRLNFELTLI